MENTPISTLQEQSKKYIKDMKKLEGIKLLNSLGIKVKVYADVWSVQQQQRRTKIF